MDELEIQLIEKARLLNRIDKEWSNISKKVDEKNFGQLIETKDDGCSFELSGINGHLLFLGFQAFELHKLLLTLMSNIDIISIHDDEAKSVVTKIKNRHIFKSVGWFLTFFAIHENNLKDFGFGFKDMLASYYKPEKIFNNEFKRKWEKLHGAESYFERKTFIGPLITSSPIPLVALKYFNELREIYVRTGFDYTLSCYSLCRSMVEICLKDKLKKHGFFKNKKVVKFDLYKDDRLIHLIGKAKSVKIIDDKHANIAHNIRKKANRMLHPNLNFQDIKHDDFHNMIKCTVEFIEYLYK